MECPECESTQIDKYWIGHWGLTKYYCCLSCDCHWHIGPYPDYKPDPPEDQRLHATGAEPLPGLE